MFKFEKELIEKSRTVNLIRSKAKEVSKVKFNMDFTEQSNCLFLPEGYEHIHEDITDLEVTDTVDINIYYGYASNPYTRRQTYSYRNLRGVV